VLVPLLKPVGTSVAGRVKTSCSVYILEDKILFKRVHVAPFFPAMYLLYFLGTSYILDSPAEKKNEANICKENTSQPEGATLSNVQISLYDQNAFPHKQENHHDAVFTNMKNSCDDTCH